MPVYAFFIILLVVIGMWAVWQYMKDPVKTILLIILGAALVFYLLKLMGLIHA